MLDGDYHDLNASQRDVLFILRTNPGLTGAEIARECHYSEAAVTHAIRRLEDDGFVTREDADGVPGKSYRNSLTDKGRSVTTAAFSQFEEAL